MNSTAAIYGVNGHGVIAVRAVKLCLENGIGPYCAWMKALEELRTELLEQKLLDNLNHANKPCPRYTFCSLCEERWVKGLEKGIDDIWGRDKIKRRSLETPIEPPFNSPDIPMKHAIYYADRALRAISSNPELAERVKTDTKCAMEELYELVEARSRDSQMDVVAALAIKDPFNLTLEN